MHTTWLILGAFGALGVAGLLWVAAEKYQHRSEWSRQDVAWMAGFSGALIGCALLYRVGTHSRVANAATGSVSDLFAVGISVAVPIVLWNRWHTWLQDHAHGDGEEPISSAHFSRTILGLQDYSPPVTTNRDAEVKEEAPAVASVVNQPVVSQPVAMQASTMQPSISQPAVGLERTPEKQSEAVKEQIKDEAIGMENMTILNLDAQPSTAQLSTTPAAPAQSLTPPQPSTPEPVMSQQFTPQPAPTPMATSQPMPSHSWMSQPPAQERSSVPAAGFREQLIALNVSWQRIEETGKELEDWFQRQHKRVFAHLERPGARSQENSVELSRDYLEQKMDRVDAEWAAIHRTIRDMYRWLENGSAERDVPKETKVW
ncbi:hypothetical protein H7849_13720 [Alloacidobacterium dinghuense]|uniref:Uncharacterized protein n=1 Tax=Alloacidobacterium dinghuense TaxID=2763107 RepID=A0A7G8BCH6_9BACT|nr:hypothetical protein [Alloacidobacterium dinghuense]QNI30246.1 hypothetical protein H7849_13720 [Alloacidobacterium dinghuense]